MSQYIIKRLLLTIPTLFGAAILVFFLMRLIPGDICELRLAGSGGYFDEAALKICQHELGIDQPIIVQLGTTSGASPPSISAIRCGPAGPSSQEISLRFQLSLMIAILATVTATTLAIPLGTIAAIKQDTWIDYVVRTFSIAGIAIPSFWFGIMIIFGILFTTQWWTGIPWMPPIQYKSTGTVGPTYPTISLLIWPAIATGYRYSAVATRMTRSAMLKCCARTTSAPRAPRACPRLIIRATRSRTPCCRVRHT